MEHVLQDQRSFNTLTCLEPACGVGHISKVLAEYFGEVQSSDIHEYGYGAVRDFLAFPYETGSCDWVITNPPFRLAEAFVHRSLRAARKGVAVLVRTVFIESVGRYEKLFRVQPPTKFAQFTERVAMVKGRLDRKASTATGYGWLVWDKQSSSCPQLAWVPPCRKTLERAGDYELPKKPSSVGVNVPDSEPEDLFGIESAEFRRPVAARRTRAARAGY